MLFDANESSRLYVPDLLAVSTLRTDDDDNSSYESSWSTTDYHLRPYDAQQRPQPEPYYEIVVASSGNYSFPTGVLRGVQINGTWGFSSATPPVIEQACIDQVVWMFQNRGQPEQVQADGAYGRIGYRLLPSVRQMCLDFKLVEVA
jgi:hypothetical protein